VNFLRSLALQELRKFDDSLRLDVVEIARRLTCFLSASVKRKDLQFCIRKTLLFNNNTGSVL
jgi:hypothetical protein